MAVEEGQCFRKKTKEKKGAKITRIDKYKTMHKTDTDPRRVNNNKQK